MLLKKVSIVLPCFRNAGLTRECLERIKLCTKIPYEIILIDDFSDDGDGTFKVISNFDLGMPKTVVRNEVGSGGCSRVWNQGIKLTTKEYILIMSNDVMVTDNWLSRMLDTFDKDPNIAVVCPSLASHNPRMAHWLMGDVPYTTETFNEFARKKSIECKEKYNNAVMGPCFLFNRKLLNEIGAFDEEFGLGGYEESDWFQRLCSKGYAFATREDIWCYHYGSMAFMKMGNREAAIIKDHNYFQLKERIRARFKGWWVNDNEVQRIAWEERKMYGPV